MTTGQLRFLVLVKASPMFHCIASKVRVENNDNWNEEKVFFKLQIYKMRGRNKIFKILTLGSPNLVFCKTKEWWKL